MAKSGRKSRNGSRSALSRDTSEARIFISQSWVGDRYSLEQIELVCKDKDVRVSDCPDPQDNALKVASRYMQIAGINYLDPGSTQNDSPQPPKRALKAMDYILWGVQLYADAASREPTATACGLNDPVSLTVGSARGETS